MGIIEGETIGELLPYYISSMFGLYVYFSVSSLVDAKGKAQQLRVNLIDYLENHLAKHLDLIQEKEMQPFLNVNRSMENGETLAESAKMPFSDKEQEELEQLLREFLA